MPSIEYNSSTKTRHNAVPVSNYSRVFLSYSCPVCRRYTIHKPRVDDAGECFVDHKRVSLSQMAFDGSKHFVGFQAVDTCFVPGVHPAADIETTRTVIRVK